MATTRAVGHDQRVLGRFARGRQQAQLGHLHRCFIMLGFIAEWPGHAATTGVDRFDLQSRDPPQDFLDARHQAEGLLVAVSVH